MGAIEQAVLKRNKEAQCTREAELFDLQEAEEARLKKQSRAEKLCQEEELFALNIGVDPKAVGRR